MDDRHIEIVVDAVREALLAFAKVHVHESDPTVTMLRRRTDVSCVIGMSGRKEKGALILALPEETALKLSTTVLGQTCRAVDGTVVDCMGEILNVVAGNVAAGLAGAGIDLAISIPSVLVGRDLSVMRPKDVPFTAIDFESDAGPFSVKVGFAPVAK